MAKNVFDGNPGTDWTTEKYQGGQFPSTKPGVGVYVKAYKQATAAVAKIVTPDTNMSVEIYGAGTVPTTLNGWQKLGTASGDVNGKTIKLTPVANLRYFMIWITKLPPDGQAHISEFDLRR